MAIQSKRTPAVAAKKAKPSNLPARSAATKTVAKKKPAAKKKPVTFAAPADFKSHFLLVSVTTEKDGLIGGKVKATRYQGRFDPQADDKKKFDLGSYDQDTLRAINARLAAITFKVNPDRAYSPLPKERVGVKGAHRLPRAALFHLLMRVGSRKADGALAVSVQKVFQRVAKVMPSGKRVEKTEQLEKTDPCYRMLRRASRILPAAFAEVLLPPKRTRGSRKSSEGDTEE